MIVDRIRSGSKFAWSHRTKALGAIAMGAAYVLGHPMELGLFMTPGGVAEVLGGFGAAAFFIGLFNTYFPDKPSP